MDNLLYDPAIALIRGKIGPWVYARNRPDREIRRPLAGGMTVPTPAQSAWLAFWYAAVARWNANLSEPQRIAWRTFADQYILTDQLKQSYRASGKNAHAGQNAIANKFGGVWLDDPPADKHCHQPVSALITTATHTPQSLIVHLQGTLDADEYSVFSGALYHNPGFHNPARLWRYYANDQVPLPRDYDATTDYTAEFGALPTNKRVFVRFQIANAQTGVISQPVWCTALVTAGPGIQLLLNPDFETGTPGNQAPDWWNWAGNDLLIATDFAEHGLQSGKIDNPTETYSNSEQTVTPLDLGTYTLEGYIRTSALTGAGRGALLEARGTPSDTLMTTSYNNHPIPGIETQSVTGIMAADTPADWTFCKMIFTLAAPDTGIRIYTVLGGAGNIQGTGWWDNLLLTPGP